VDPVAALERIVHCLDRALAPAPKVRAFRRATEVVRATDADEIAHRSREGTLTELDGIGEVTARVISEALDGRTPTYLARLEDQTTVEPTEGAALRASLRGDLHSHSTWSDGGATLEAMARTAMALGHEYLAVTDHSPRLTVAHGLSRELLFAQLDEIERLNAELSPFRTLTGIEVDILEDGSLDHDDEVLARLDVVVASVHSKLRMARDDMTRRMVLAIANPHVDVLGHCTGRKLSGAGRAPSTFDADIVFATCARFDTAVEINCRPERQDPPEDLLDLALQWGCKVAVNSDAHATGQLEWLPYGCDKAARSGVDATRVVNAWPVEDLLSWAGAHPGG
jgi:putative hydrolase